MSLAANSSVPNAGSTSTAANASNANSASRRDNLIASLQALMANDTIDLEVLAPGNDWSQIELLEEAVKQHLEQQQQQPRHPGHHPLNPPPTPTWGVVGAPHHPGSSRDPSDIPTPPGLGCDDSHLVIDPTLRPEFSFGGHEDVDFNHFTWLGDLHDANYEPMDTGKVSPHLDLPFFQHNPHGHTAPASPSAGHHHHQHHTSTGSYFSQSELAAPIDFGLSSSRSSSTPSLPNLPNFAENPHKLTHTSSWDMVMDFTDQPMETCEPAGSSGKSDGSPSDLLPPYASHDGTGPHPLERKLSSTGSTLGLADSTSRLQVSGAPSLAPSLSPSLAPSPRSERQPSPSFRENNNGNNNNGGNNNGNGRQQRRQRAHYVIEKRYRAGLNERFEALRDCIESRKANRQGRSASLTSLTGEGADGAEQQGGNTGAAGNSTKMNKAEVLQEAVVYIHQLEEENEVVLEHLKLLIRRLRATKNALQQIESSPSPPAKGM